MKDLKNQARLEAALQEYQNRQARVNHPDGTFDNAQRWYPSEAEHCECCDAIRSPSRAWPYTLNKHCRSIQHVAHLYDVDARELRKLAREAKTQTQSQPALAVA